MRTRQHDQPSEAGPAPGGRSISSHRKRRSLVGRYFAVIGALTLVGGVAAAGAGVGVGEADAATKVTRSEAIARAKQWANVPVPYSMNRTRDGYRTDCSGMISRAYKLGKPGLTTSTLPNVGVRISKNQLKPGDFINKVRPHSGTVGHVVMFEKWANSAKTAYIGIEQTPPHTKRRVIPYPYFNGGSGYKPYRYKHIQDDKPKPKPTKPRPTASKPKPEPTKTVKPEPTKPKPTKPKPTKSEPTKPGKPTPTASATAPPEPTEPNPSETGGGGGGEGDEGPQLPKTGAPALLVAGTGGALLLGGTVLLLVGRRRGRYGTRS